MEGPKKGTSQVDGAATAIAAAQLGVGGMQAMTDIIGSIQNAADRKLIIELSNFTNGPMVHPK